MSTVDTSTWNPDADLNVSIEGIPLNSDAPIAQTWQALRVLMAAVKGDGDAIKSMIDVMHGATASADGASGLVPQPLAGDQDKVLKGDGTWGAAATANHVHGNISNAGAIGSTSGLPIVTGTNGILQAGSFGNAAGTVCEGNDSRLSDARTPISHTHGNVTNDGKLSTASRAVVTDGSKVIDVSSVTSTELGYLSGVTSALQTQIDSKAADSAAVHKTGDESVSGTKTFSTAIKYSSTDAGCSSVSTSFIQVSGGSTSSKGGRAAFFGESHPSYAGFVQIRASASATKVFELRPDGTATWNGQAIQTSSDERLKTPLISVPDAVLDAWESVNWGQFKFLDAVGEKEDKARLHLGLVAQKVNAVFRDHDLDACQYGILCYDEKEDVWMVRYTEALAMEAACQRRRADRLEARIAALEEAMNA